MIRTATLAVLLVLASGPVALGAELAVDPASRVSFDAKITAGSFVATSKELAGVVLLDESSGTIEAATIRAGAASFETGIRMRDTHMRDKYLEAAKHPEIVLEVAEQPTTTAMAAASVLDAVMVVKGVRREMKVPVQVESEDGGTLRITSEFPLDIRDFGIPQPSFTVVKMDPVIQVKVVLVLARKK